MDDRNEVEIMREMFYLKLQAQYLVYTGLRLVSTRGHVGLGGLAKTYHDPFCSCIALCHRLVTHLRHWLLFHITITAGRCCCTYSYPEHRQETASQHCSLRSSYGRATARKRCLAYDT